MSLLDRFLGGNRNKACSEGVALLEQEKYAEAVERLREASLGRSDHPSHSLASFHFRQALVARGRELLRSGDAARAESLFAEAVGLWDQYPDLHCLHGAASGIGGNWEGALQGAKAALRRNPDYVEARLLEGLALMRLERSREASESLNALVESGRRVEHWLIEGLASGGEFSEDNLPEDLEGQLLSSVSGRSEKEEVASAVAQCRAGRWEEGLERFAVLVRKRPRYPDYRTRHGAALFHLGRNEEALAEVEAALALNETYRTAIDLKGLILADMGRLGEAAGFLERSDGARGETDRQASAHEELFGSYLRGVLALLAGRPEETERVLGNWKDLARNFARAELLLAAADDLLERPNGCVRRLAGLASEWPGESLYFYLLACHQMRHRRYEDAADPLGRWPAVPGAEPDLRPIFLEGHLAVCRGQAPDGAAWPDPAGLTSTDTVLDRSGCPVVGPAAWRYLQARAAFLAGDDKMCWEFCRELAEEGLATERTLRLQVQAAVGAEVPADWKPDPVVPESCLAGQAALLAANDGDVAGPAVRHLRVHPDSLTGLWLLPDFWFQPVRGWIA